MARKHYQFPPLTTLASFEAAARHMSFKKAAEELNVTAGAVSHQIKVLETELAQPLFQRHHRSVSLTDAGTELFRVLNSSFGKIASTLNRLRENGNDPSVMITATTAVSTLWLGPRLAKFWKEHSDIAVNQQVSDTVDNRGFSPNTDLLISYGEDGFGGMQKTSLFRDTLVPVCAPQFAEKQNDLSLAAIAKMPLIHLKTPNSIWTTWRLWFDKLGYHGAQETGRHVNNYSIALQTAQDGVGVVLGWKKLVAPLILEGKLVPLGPHSLLAPESFYIISQPQATISNTADLMRTWLIKSAG